MTRPHAANDLEQVRTDPALLMRVEEPPWTWGTIAVMVLLHLVLLATMAWTLALLVWR